MNENKWVDVNERLPKQNVKVLAYAPCGDATFVGYVLMFHHLKKPKWKILTANGSEKNMIKKVTHWMELPEPPMMGEE